MRRPRVLIIGAAAAIAVAALIVLPLELTGGGSPAPKHQVAQSHKAAAPSRPAQVRRRRLAHRQAVENKKLRAALRGAGKRRAHAPIGHRHGNTWIPWRPDGTSLVAGARKHWLAVYRLPHAKHPILRLHNPDKIGTPRVLLVHSKHQRWVRVYLPTRPNGATGWVRSRAVRVLRNPYRIVIRLRAHKLYLFRGKHRILRAATVVGRPTMPTPVGMYYVVDLLKPPDPHGAYGPFTFDLSAHSNVLKTFDGGDGHVAVRASATGASGFRTL